MDIQKKVVLLTGGTGSFGTSFIDLLLSKPEIDMVRIYSRDEHKQQALREKHTTERLSFYIGDVRDKDHLSRAMEDCDWVVHAAALKQAPLGEIYPMEFIKTNVLGSWNVLQACLDNYVEKCLLVSTDKAVYPINLYGATKMCAEKLFIQANRMKGSRISRFSCTRYGNVANSRGTIVPKFLALKDGERVPITHPSATRFWIPLKDANAFVYDCLLRMEGGEIFVPKLPSVMISDVAEALCPGREWAIIGERPGDKRHEVLISGNEYVEDMGDYLKVIDYSPEHTPYSSNQNRLLSQQEILDSIGNGTQSREHSIKAV